MIKAIFVTDYGKHYFERLIPHKFGYLYNASNPGKSEFLIFDNNDNAKEIHHRITGYYRFIANGDIPIFRIEEYADKPAKAIPFTKSEIEYWLKLYYIDWESTWQSQKKYNQLMHDMREQRLLNDAIALHNRIDEAMFKSIKDANPKIFALVKN